MLAGAGHGTRGDADTRPGRGCLDARAHRGRRVRAQTCPEDAAEIREYRGFGGGHPAEAEQ